MFVCNYDRKIFVDNQRQKYVEITNNCLRIKIADKHLRFLQTKHLQCNVIIQWSSKFELIEGFF